MSSQDGACSFNSSSQQQNDNAHESQDNKQAQEEEAEIRDYTDDEDIDLSYQQLVSGDLFQLNPDWKGSLVEYYGPNSSYCGYCKVKADDEPGGRKSFDMHSYRLTPFDYQDLLDRGWRRSGKYCYCPVNKSTCCPNYPITCKTTEFKFTWSQRRCIENLNSYLMTGRKKERIKLNYANNDSSDLNGQIRAQSFSDIDGLKQNRAAFALLRASPKARSRRFVQSCERKVKLYKISLNEAIRQTKAKWLARQPKIPSLEDYLFPSSSSLEGCNIGDVDIKNPSHKLRIKMCHVESKLSKDSRSVEHDIMVKYQKAIHHDDLKEWTMSRYCDFLVSSPLLTDPIENFKFVADSNSSPEDDDNLSKKAHSRTDFILVEPPELPTAFGTYHCNYYLDDKMIAVGVLDVLPRCITTVYLFYDPEYTFLNLGIYSALIEISMVRQLHKYYIGSTTKSDNQLIYYHMGFYVHVCKKMHYKTRFRPSYLLCPKTFRYVPTDICLKKLEGKKYAPFAVDESSNASQRIIITLENLSEIPINSHVIPNEKNLIYYLRWVELNYGEEFVELLVDGYLTTYAHLVGPKLVPKLCLRLNAVHRTLSDRYRQLKRECEQKKAIKS